MNVFAMVFLTFFFSFKSYGQTEFIGSCAQQNREAIGQEFAWDAARGAIETLERNGIVVSGMTSDLRFPHVRTVRGMAGSRVMEVISTGTVRLITQNGSTLRLVFSSNTSELVQYGRLFIQKIEEQLVLLFEDFRSRAYDREGNVTSQATNCNVGRSLLSVRVVNEASNRAIVIGTPIWGERGFFWDFIGN